MTNMKIQNVRGQLRSAASVIALVAGAIATVGSADAGPVQLTSSSGTYNLYSSKDSAIELLAGTKAYYVKNNVTWAPPSNSLKLGVGDSNGNTAGISTTGSCVFSWDCGNSKAPTITVDSGASLTFAGRQTVNYSWYFGNVELQSALISNGDLVFENPGPTQSWGSPLVAFLGANQMLGNVTLLDSAYVQSGYTWSLASTVFGQNTNLILGNNSKFEINQTASAPLVMGGAISGTGTLLLGNGTLIVNGQNTAANPFTGTLTINPAQTFVVGDATHSTAVFGNPASPSTYTLAIKGTSAGAAVLRGTGTVAGAVANTGGLVQPGYGATLSSLTVQSYTQDSVGTLKIEVSPTAVAGLHVLGNATLDGTLNLTIDPGTYATKIYNIVQVDGTLTGGFSSITTSSLVQGAIAAVTKTSNGYQVVTQVVQGATATAPVVQGHLLSANRLNNYYVIASLYDQIDQDSPRNATSIGANKYAWIQGFGRHSSVSRNDVGYHTTTAGFTAGVEYRNEANSVAGVAVSYSTSDLKAKGASSAAYDTWHGAVYGGADVQYARLEGVLFYNGYGATTKRNFGTDGIATQTPYGYAYGASLQLSRDIFKGWVTPYFRGIFSRQHVEGGAETGTLLLNLSYNAIDRNTLVGDLGLHIDPLHNHPEYKTKLLVNLALEHDFSALGEKVSGTFPVTAGQAWNTYWRGDSENTLVGGVDVSHQLTDKLELSGRVSGRASLFQTSGEVAVNAKYKF